MMKVIYSEDHRLHVTGQGGYDHPEVVERAEYIVQSLGESKKYSIVPPADHPPSFIEEAHSPAYRAFLESFCRRLGPEDQFIPPSLTASPSVLDTGRPEDICGYYCFGQDTPLCGGTYRAALSAVDAALTGGDALLAGQSAVYALCRPPGHHAEKEKFGGFCYFNNAYIAAAALAKKGKTVILDVDFHHGNGTQHLTYRRDDIMYISLHGHPATAYPHFTGWDHETGEDEGRGLNCNFPLPPGTTGEIYFIALDKAIEKIGLFSPEFLLISMGFDTYKDDPISQFRLERDDFSTMGKKLAGLDLPILIIQEGGYCLSRLGSLARAFLDPFC
jgi:acetoin utilization deacetylase AcuC-like enzyme